MKQERTEGNLTFLPVNRDTYIDRVMVDTPAEEVPPFGLFDASFNNRKKQGKQGLQTYRCQGTLYETGHVHIDTFAVQVRDFQTLRQMIDYLQEFGDCHISWLRGE